MTNDIATLRLTVNDGALIHLARTLDQLAAAGVADAAVLPVLVPTLKKMVDAKAEAIRASVATAGTGQAMEYEESQAQALAALAEPSDATATKYPMLAATIGIDIDPTSKAAATDVLGVARAIVAARAAWVTLGAAVKRARLLGKDAIESAPTVAAAVAAYAAIQWPTAT